VFPDLGLGGLETRLEQIGHKKSGRLLPSALIMFVVEVSGVAPLSTSKATMTSTSIALVWHSPLSDPKGRIRQ